MHAKRLVHRDVKPEAFRVGGSDSRTIKLGDFGNSVMLESGKLKGECGTPLYMAPEMITGKVYDEKIDVWSLGVIVYILLFGGNFPFVPKDRNRCSDIKLVISSSQAEPSFTSPVSLSGSATAFAMSLLERSPSNRPSAGDALKKAYMVSVMAGTHEIDADLPCLRFGLIRGKQTKVLDARGQYSEIGIESLLNQMQMEAFGIPLPIQNTTFLGLLGSENSGKSAKSAAHWKVKTTMPGTTANPLDSDLVGSPRFPSEDYSREDPWLCQCDL
jgi:serine/threonine protein kinase